MTEKFPLAVAYWQLSPKSNHSLRNNSLKFKLTTTG